MVTLHKWDKPSLILHFIFAAAVINQLITSQLMQKYSSIFYVHVAGGVTAFVMLLIYVGLKLKQNKFMDFFPHHVIQFIEVKNDFMNMLRFKSLPNREVGGLPGLVQGLGILLILAMALTGATGFIVYHWLPWKEVAVVSINIHSTLATFVWIYIIGHTAMAVLHWGYRFLTRRTVE